MIKRDRRLTPVPQNWATYAILISGILGFGLVTLAYLWLESHNLPIQSWHSSSGIWSTLAAIFLLPVGFYIWRLRHLNKLIELEQKFADQEQSDRDMEIRESMIAPAGYASAIKLLGDTDQIVRAGGVYALEQVALSSPSYWTPVIETLVMFLMDRLARIRNDNTDKALSLEKNTYHAQADDKSGLVKRFHADIRAIFVVISRRPNDKATINLSNLVFRNLDLSHCDMKRINFSECTLNSIEFGNCSITDVDFSNSNLMSCNFDECNMVNIAMNGSKGSGIKILKSKLKTVNLAKTTIGNSHVNDTDFTECVFSETIFATSEFNACNFYSDIDPSSSFNKGNLNRCAFQTDITKFENNQQSGFHICRFDLIFPG